MKPSDHNEFDERMKNAFDDFEMPVSERVWLGIEKDLEKRNTKTTVLWFARLSVAASVAMLVAFFAYNQFNTSEATQQASSAVQPSQVGSQPEISTTADAALLADVVEIKRSNVPAKGAKPSKKSAVTSLPKAPVRITPQERDAIELLKKSEQTQSEKVIPSAEPARNENTKPQDVVSPSPSIAAVSPSSKKKEVEGLNGILNYVSDKVLGEDLGGLVAVNETTEEDGKVRRKTEVDLGIVKFSRSRNGN